MKTRILFLILTIIVVVFIVVVISWRSRDSLHRDGTGANTIASLTTKQPQAETPMPAAQSSNRTAVGSSLSRSIHTKDTTSTTGPAITNGQMRSPVISSNMAGQTSILYGRRCYKLIGSKLVLGRMDKETGFVADVPETAIDLDKSTPVSLRYPVLPESIQSVTTVITNSRGKVVRVRFDAKTGRLQYEMLTP